MSAPKRYMLTTGRLLGNMPLFYARRETPIQDLHREVERVQLARQHAQVCTDLQAHNAKAAGFRERVFLEEQS